MAYIIASEDNSKFLNSVGSIITNTDSAFRWTNKCKAQNYLNNCSRKKVKGFRVIDEYDILMSDSYNSDCAIEKLDNLTELLRDLYSSCITSDRISFLNSRIQKLDLEIVDIQHAIEFSNASSVGGYKYYKMLRDVLVQRRKYKDELQKINIIRSTLSEVMANNLIKSLEGANNKQYQPRVLKELFE